MACPNITDAGLPALLSMTNLTALDLRGCTGLTDRGLLTLARKTNWESLMFGGCSNVSAAGVASLQRALPNAQEAKVEFEYAAHR